MKEEMYINKNGIQIMSFPVNGKMVYCLSYYVGDGVSFDCTTEGPLTFEEIEELNMFDIMPKNRFF